MLNWILMRAALLFLVLGAADYIMGGRFGLAEEFRHGLMVAGDLLLCMTGFMVLAPAIARGLSGVISPLFRAVGADPSLFAAILLANDSGGAVLAAELADEVQAGLFNGQIVAAMLGATMMFNIPMVLQTVSKEKREAAVYGLLAGVITIPVGCVISGLMGGFSADIIVKNTGPVLVLSLLLTIILIFFSEKVVPLFRIWGKIVTTISVVGITLGTIHLLIGVQLVPGMDSLNEPFQIIGGICVFLAGMFPFMAVVRRVFRHQFMAAGRKLAINQASVSGLLSTLVNGLPTLAMLNEMDDRGRMLNTAFMVSASCAIGDHLAFASQTAPELIGSLVVGKLAAGTAAVLVAMVLQRWLLNKRAEANG